MRTIPLLHDLKSKREMRNYKVSYMTKAGVKKVMNVFTSGQGVANRTVKRLAEFGRMVRA